MTKAQKTCFVISPIGELGSETRDRADLVFEFVIAATLEPMGFTVERADKLGEPGIITNQIIDRVTSSDLVIADLSERNPNVFYELAIRHVARKPYVHLIAHDEDIPFDNAAVRAIKIDVRDLRSIKAAKEDLSRQVKAAMIPSARVESPVSIALSIQEMRTSGDEEKLAISSLSSEISQIRRSMKEIVSFVSATSAAQLRSSNPFVDFPGGLSLSSGSPDLKAANALALQNYLCSGQRPDGSAAVANALLGSNIFNPMKSPPSPPKPKAEKKDGTG